MTPELGVVGTAGSRTLIQNLGIGTAGGRALPVRARRTANQKPHPFDSPPLVGRSGQAPPAKNAGRVGQPH